jgi:serine/threonine-protein phosphatase Stp1
VITRAVGAEGLEVEKVTDRLYRGDRFLLCSDGVFKSLPEHILAEVLATDHDDTAERLLAAALDRQAGDNITAVTVEVLGDG